MSAFRRVFLVGILFFSFTGLVQAQDCTATGGVDWTARSAADVSQWFSVTYGGGQFVAVSQAGTTQVMTSPDGINWTAHSAAEANIWRSVTYGGGQFVAVAYSGTNRVMTSPDGINWTARSAAEDNQWISVTYGGGQFVAVATNGVMTSPDGINWTSRNPGPFSNWKSVTYGGGQFVAVSDSGSAKAMTSPDGINWTQHSVAETGFWQSVTYGKGQFVAVGILGTKRVMTSPDGINWTARNAAELIFWNSVTYGGGQFVAVGSGGTNQVMTSPDGINWTARSATSANIWRSVTYGGGQFVAVNNNATDEVMTSSCDQTTPAEGTAVLTIQKVFSDGNDETDVTLKLQCTSGSYTPAMVTVTPETGLQHVFVIDEIPDVNGAGVDCTVVEEPVAGYTAQYRCPTVDSMSATDPSCEPDGDEVPAGNFACSWTNVQAGDSNNCLIMNAPTPVKVEVTKVWEEFGAGGINFDRDATVTISCDAEIVGGDDYGSYWSISQDLDDSDGDYEDKDGKDVGLAKVTAKVIPAWYTTAVPPAKQQYTKCWASESGMPSSVDVSSDCGETYLTAGMQVSLGHGDSCTITNTQFFEGIPTLNQFGTAIMALLMLGIGMVGFRRFA